MAFDKAKTYLESFGLADRIIVTEHSSATVSEAAEAIGCEPAMIAKTLSFLQEAGSDYQEALDEGADPTTAGVYAFVTAFINSGIEIGVEGDSGIQGLGQGKDGGFMGKLLTAVTGKDLDMLASIIQSGFEEGGEEFRQSLVSGLVKKATYKQNMPYISLSEDMDAVFNVPKTLQEAEAGLWTGIALGATSNPGTTAYYNRAADTQTGSQIIGNNQAQALAGIAEDSAHIHNKTTAGIKNGTIDLNTKAGQRAVGKLFRETYASIDEQSRNALDSIIMNPIQLQLMRDGYNGDATEVARVIAKEYHGEELTPEEREIFDDPTVAQAATRIFYNLGLGEDLNTLYNMPNLNKQDTHSTDQEGAKPQLSQVNTGKYGAVGAKEEDLDKACLILRVEREQCSINTRCMEQNGITAVIFIRDLV